MTCPGDGTFTAPGSPPDVMWRFENWSRTHAHIVPLHVMPNSVKQLVAAVQATEKVRGTIKAIGSGWSYPDVAIAPEVTFAVSTDRLKAVLTSVIPFALNDATRPDARHFVHVEAGIKVHDLNCALDAMGLAMITLGGSNGQSVAGAIATGTHGSDVDLAPIADVVRAIHLVGPGGQEWWIERKSRQITDRTKMDQLRFAQTLCPDLRVEYDDLLFDAVLVSVGRMGIVYSYVVEVRDAFMLKQTRAKQNWTDAANFIRTDIRDNLAADIRWVEIVVNPYPNSAGDHDAVITRRVISTEDPTPASPPSPITFEFFCNITAMNRVLDDISAMLPPLIATAAAAAVAGLSWMIFIPFIGPELFATASSAAVTAATATLVALEAAVHAVRTAPGEDVTHKLASILNTTTQLGHKEFIPLLTEQLLLQQRNPNDPVLVGPSFELLTSQPPCDQPWAGPAECLRAINGLEFAFDLGPGVENLFAFVTDLMALSTEFLGANMPPGFVISLRFTKQTDALLGMQQASRNCMVEFIMLRGITGEADFLNRVRALAMLHDARPHWGLMHEIDAAEVARLYSHLGDWRMALGRLIEEGGGRIETFRTSYSVARGLEPLFGGLVVSDNRPVVIHLWDPTPQAQGSTSTTGIYLWNRSGHPTNVTAVRITTPQDAPGAPVFRVQTPLPVALAASQVFLLGVIFSPVNPGPITGMVEVDCDDPITPTVRVPLATSATALGRHAELVVTPATLDLANVLVGGTVGANVTLRNIGFYAAGFDSIAVILDSPPGQFAVPQVLPSNIAPGQSDTIYVSFNPTNRGAARATLAIDMRSRTDLGTVDYRHRYTVGLTALALRPIIFLARGRQQTRPGVPLDSPLDRWPGRPAPGDARLPRPPRFEEPELSVLDFGAAAPGTSVAASFWIRNIGDAPLTVAGVAIVNQGSFGVTDVTIFPRTLVAGEEMEVPANFLAYSVPGMRASGEFRVISDDPLRSTATLIVTGRAAGPHLSDPSELLDLGVVPPAASSANLVFHSDGTDPVTVRKVTLATGADFALSGVPVLPAQLAPGSDLSFTVELVSLIGGQHQDQVVVAHNGRASGNSQVLVRARVP